MQLRSYKKRATVLTGALQGRTPEILNKNSTVNLKNQGEVRPLRVVARMEKKYIKLALSKLKINDKNPKLHDDQAIKSSIDEIGYINDIIVDENNIILAGHGRFKAVKDLGYKDIDVIQVFGLTDEQKEKYMLLDNKLVELGGWDIEKLKGFEIELLREVGFGDQLHKIYDINEDNFDAEKEYDNIKEPKAKYGDTYQLGRHRLMCGDSAKEEDVKRLLEGKKGRLIFTDPPYNVNYRSPGGLDYNSAKYGGTGGKIFNDNKSDDECLKFYTDVLKNLYKFTTDDATIYWWFAHKNVWINQFAFNSSGWHMSQIIIWLKNSMVFSRGQDYHRMYEPCMFGWKTKKSHFKNKKINDLKDVFNLEYQDFSELLDVWYQKRDSVTEYVHPTQKPIKLAERAINKNSVIGDIVLDMFGGSGSTLMACEQMDRACYAMELDPKYVDVIIKRWEQFTGDKATKLNNSQ